MKSNLQQEYDLHILFSRPADFRRGGFSFALLDNTGMVVVEYKYDAWGKCLTSVLDPNASAIAELNPFRYRGYYFDTETNLYYLQTRYYDPEVGRFINNEKGNIVAVTAPDHASLPVIGTDRRNL